MIAIFYDRRNKLMVRSDQLVPTNCVAEVLQGDSQEGSYLNKPISELLEPEKGRDAEGEYEYPGALTWHTIQIATLGYKSESCPGYMNFDKQCSLSDLVFLELVP